MRILLIDDTRDESAPNIQRRVDLIARNYWTGVDALVKMGPWDLVLLDHDLHSYLDGKEYTGYHIICEIERMVNNSEMERPDKIVCVSSNPPGRARINSVIEKLYGKVF